jgi:hypothetical protein
VLDRLADRAGRLVIGAAAHRTADGNTPVRRAGSGPPMAGRASGRRYGLRASHRSRVRVGRP